MTETDDATAQPPREGQASHESLLSHGSLLRGPLDERLLSDAEVLRIAAVHAPTHCNGLSWCRSCLEDWPCHTIRFVRDHAALIEQLAAAEGRAAAEDAEDLAAAESVKGEPLIPWETVKAEIDAADGRAQEAQISDAQRALEVLHQIHQDHGRGYCDVCTERYPCTTILEVDALAACLRKGAEEGVTLAPEVRRVRVLKPG